MYRPQFRGSYFQSIHEKRESLHQAKISRYTVSCDSRDNTDGRRYVIALAKYLQSALRHAQEVTVPTLYLWRHVVVLYKTL